MQAHGIILSIGSEEKINERFKKREFILQVNPEKPYPQEIVFELHNDNTDIIDAYQENQSVSVDFLLRGKKYTNKNGQQKHINTLVVWKIQKV